MTAPLAGFAQSFADFGNEIGTDCPFSAVLWQVSKWHGADIQRVA